MMRHVWSVLTERISTDSETNSVSYLTCVEQATSPRLPAVIPTVSLGTLWHKDTEGEATIEMRVLIVPPTAEVGELVHVGPAPVMQRSQRINVNLDGLRLDEAGRYELKVEQKVGDDWKTEASIPLVLVHDPLPT